MTEGNRPQVLTDAQWELLAPRIAACRPRHKAEPHDLRRTIEAIIWRHDHGAKWRQIPAELGPWWMAAQTFSRWSRLGAWERMLGLAQQRGGVEAGMGWRQCLQPSTAPASERTTRAQARRKRGTLGRARRAGGARSVARRLWDQGVRDRRCLRSRHRLRPRAGARAATDELPLTSCRWRRCS
jgi:transposase